MLERKVGTGGKKGEHVKQIVWFLSLCYHFEEDLQGGEV